MTAEAYLVDLDQGLAADYDRHIALFKTCLKAGASELEARFEAHDPTEDLVRARALFIDEILTRAWRLHLAETTGATLVAVGGYGRGELHPASDVDVLILTGEDPETLADPIERFVMLLWDIGLEIGHSVRNIAQCIAEAARDVTVITNLTESRLVTGDAALFERMLAATGPQAMWPSDQYFAAKLAEQEARHRKYDDTAYNLEPNIKENPGGLRDIQMIGWVAKRHFGASTMADLVERGFLTDHEYHSLMSCQSLLWRIRFALHMLTGRHEDRLLFDHQRALAARFGYIDGEANLAVEQFMQAYYRAVMRLNRLNEMLLQHFREAIILKDELGSAVPINRRFQARSGYIEVINQGTFARSPLALLEIFLLLQQHPDLQGVRASTIRLIRAHRHLIDHRFRADIKARSLFMEILRQPSGMTHALRRMNRYGILARYIPAFGNIVGRMQYDLFHVYTVDEHTLRLIRNLRRFAIAQLVDEFPQCSEAFAELPKPELIYLAGLFHDIAKGRGGDHSLLGARDAWDFCKLHELSDYDARLVAWLVEKHLLMSTVAQRKDIEDPAVIQSFAAQVGDVNRLNHLYVLTVADVRATNPKRWNGWKNVLLRQLYRSTRRALTRGLDTP
ncbi:MAG: [protein-PII] uridylyltransferase, partial [Gammaproteobacteria bacterium]